MFGLEFIALPILAYILTALFVVIPFAGYMKAREVPTPTQARHNRTEYELEFTKHQKSLREFWECVMIFSFAWPIELVFAGGWGVYKIFAEGIRFLIRSGSNRQNEAMDRKVLAKLDDERQRLRNIEIRNGELSADDTERMANLDRLILNNKSESKRRAIAS